MVNLKINNTPMSVKEGTTILNAAKQYNIKIPHSATIPNFTSTVSVASASLKSKAEKDWLLLVRRKSKKECILSQTRPESSTREKQLPN